VTGEEEPVGKCAGLPRFTAAMLPPHETVRLLASSSGIPIYERALKRKSRTPPSCKSVRLMTYKVVAR